jgi:CxxC-x17-CxxC domain-containing protein
VAFQDQTLTCKDCGKEFVWTASEQEFYQQKGFQNPPSRCADCRKLKKQRMQGDREYFDIVCSNCGKNDKVPFKPKGDRPVLCKDCFSAQKEGRLPEAAPAEQSVEAPSGDQPAE